MSIEGILISIFFCFCPTLIHVRAFSWIICTVVIKSSKYLHPLSFSILFLYLLLFFRIIIVSYKADSIFGQLLVLAVGLPIIFQAFINMGVAVQLFPVTGQPLPLISTGGTSIWMTFLALGIVLSVSSNKKNKDEASSNNPINVLSETV